MTASNHEFWDELAAGYALRALAPDEEMQFETHLATCAECSAALADHEMVAAQLGSIAHYRETSDDPPSWESMRESILGGTVDGALDDTDVAVETYGPVEVDELAARRQRFRGSRRILAAAAAVIVIAGGGVAIWQATTSSSSSCSASPGCHTISLDAAGGTQAATVEVRDNTVTMPTADMPTAPAGKIYVLWELPRNGQATPIATFNVGDGSALPTATLQSPYADISGFAISEEDAQGAPPEAPSNTLAQGVAT
jgi:anti-sigma-K factor RskA